MPHSWKSDPYTDKLNDITGGRDEFCVIKVSLIAHILEHAILTGHRKEQIVEAVASGCEAYKKLLDDHKEQGE